MGLQQWRLDIRVGGWCSGRRQGIRKDLSEGEELGGLGVNPTVSWTCANLRDNMRRRSEE